MKPLKDIRSGWSEGEAWAAGSAEGYARAFREWAMGEGMIWTAVGAVLLDRAVTLPFVHLEANPLVNALGPGLWVVVTAVLVGALLSTWYAFRAWQYRGARVMAAVITVIHLLAAGTNVLAVAGIL